MRQQIIDKLEKYVSKGYTITEIARQLGVTQPCLYNIYYNRRTGSVATLEKIEAWIPKAPKRRKK